MEIKIINLSNEKLSKQTNNLADEITKRYGVPVTKIHAPVTINKSKDEK